jgi:hypothetical protein
MNERKSIEVMNTAQIQIHQEVKPYNLVQVALLSNSGIREIGVGNSLQ